MDETIEIAWRQQAQGSKKKISKKEANVQKFNENHFKSKLKFKTK